MKRKAISLTLCLCILLGSMGQMFAVEPEKSDSQAAERTAEAVAEMLQAKEEAEEEEPDYDLINIDGMTYVRVDADYEPIPKGDTTEVSGVAVYATTLASETITIPSTVTDPENAQDLSVLAIDDYAFCGNESAVSIELPDTIKVIGEGAFGACALLERMTLPAGVTTIEDMAFGYCDVLESVSVPASVDSIGLCVFTGSANLREITVEESNANYSSQDGVLYNAGKSVLMAYPGGKAGKFAVPSGVTEIDYAAFSETCGLTSVTTPDTLVTIGDEAFSWSSTLERVDLSSSVECIGVEDTECAVFAGSYELTAINVDEANANYSSQDGVLYDKAKTALICCPAGKSGELAIPSGVTEIGDDALMDCEELTAVILPDTMEIIGSCAFSSCDGLSELTIPINVKEIYNSAFEWCEGLTTIRFEGDMPIFGEDVFDGVTATAYYPISWESVPDAEQIGGEIKWVPDIPAVGSLKAISASYNSAEISWDAVSGAEGYVVYRKNDGKWKTLGTTTSTSYTDKNLTCGRTYTYTVRAYNTVNGKKVKGAYDSKGVSVEIVPATVKLGSATVSGSSIQVKWDTVSGANGYIVYRKSASMPKWKSIKTVGSSTTSYTDKNLDAGAYTYTVRAYRTVDGEKIKGDYDSKGVSASITPAQPKLISLSGSASGITVKWSEIDGADGYQFYRRSNGGSWKKLKEVTDATSYQDTTVEPGVKYTYTVRAFIKNGDQIVRSGYDKTGLSVIIAEQPVLVSATEKVSSNKTSVTVKWKQADNAEGYVVYRKDDINNKWKKLTTLSGGSTTSYQDTKPEGGVNYLYTVRAYTQSGKSQILSSYDSKGVSAFIPAQPVLQSAKVAPDDVIQVKWEAVANVDGYYVYRKSNKDSKWRTLAIIEDNSEVSFEDTEAENGLTYSYTVCSYVEDGETDLCSTYDASGVSTYYMEAPLIELGYDYAENDLYIFWTEVDTADGYVLYGKEPGGKWSREGKMKNSNIVREDGVCGYVYEDFDIDEQEYLITIRPYKTINGKEVLGSYLSEGVSTAEAEDITEELS